MKKEINTMSRSNPIQQQFRRSFIAVLCLFVFHLGAVYTAKGQDAGSHNPSAKPSFTIGEAVPAINYGTWIKGQPFEQFEKDRLYVFDFWATWCVPCIASMPHLSTFAKENSKDVTVVAFNIWENPGSATFASIQTKVQKFVEKMGDKMALNVATDTEDQYLGQKWMLEAGKNGIPQTYIIKNGILLWAGHPANLDSMIQVVRDPGFHISAFKAKEEEKAAQENAEQEKGMDLNTAIDNAVKANRADRAIAIIDSVAAALPADQEGSLNFIKFITLFDHVGEEPAISFLKEWQTSDPNFLPAIGAIVIQKDGLSKATYRHAIALLNQVSDDPKGKHMMLSEMALGYFKMGEYHSAIKMQKKAIKTLKKVMKTDPSAMNEDMLSTLTEKLKAYKQR